MGNCLPRKAACRKAASRKVIISSSEVALCERGYCLDQHIGKGTFSNVYSATYVDGTGESMRLACKLVNKEQVPPRFLRFFSRELDIITKISHRNIIEVHSILQREPNVHIFMRYAENGDLLNYINSHGVVEESLAKKWFAQLVGAVRYLHSMEIAHRDLKCENILISGRMNIKLADFGIARYCLDDNRMKVFSSTFCGTLNYMAPEIIEEVPYDPKLADVWSLGVILFVMLNDEFPFDYFSLRKLLADQHDKNIVYASDVEECISEDAKWIISGLLEPDPQSRCSLEIIATSRWLRGYETNEDDPENTLKKHKCKREKRTSRNYNLFSWCCCSKRHTEEDSIETIFPLAADFEMETEAAALVPLAIESSPKSNRKLKSRMERNKRYRKNRNRRLKCHRRVIRRYKFKRIRK